MDFGNVIEENVNSWEDLYSWSGEFWAQTDQSQLPTFVFRGQADAKWGLVPSLFRLARTHGLTAGETALIEKQTLDELNASPAHSQENSS